MAEQELQVARMDEETMEYLNVLFSVCKRFNTDYYHANPKQRAFMDAVATHEYQLKRHMKRPAAFGSASLYGNRSKRAQQQYACINKDRKARGRRAFLRPK